MLPIVQIILGELTDDAYYRQCSFYLCSSLTVDNETLETANALNLVCDVPMMPEIGPTVDSSTIYRLFNVSCNNIYYYSKSMYK